MVVLEASEGKDWVWKDHQRILLRESSSLSWYRRPTGVTCMTKITRLVSHEIHLEEFCAGDETFPEYLTLYDILVMHAGTPERVSHVSWRQTALM